MRDYNSIFVDGKWLSLTTHDALSVVDSATGTVMARVAAAGTTEIDIAVSAAKQALWSWACRPSAERADYLDALATVLERAEPELAEIISREVGTAIGISRAVQVGYPVTFLRDAAMLLRGFAFEELVRTTTISKEPVGVVACITPWNFPLSQVIAKVASALAVGCTVVIKPSSEAPLSVLTFAQAVAEVGFPNGVVNVVTGSGPVLGEALATHPDVAMVSFTGSTAVGRRIAGLASQSIKRVALELGGKSPNLILEDADIHEAVRDGVGRAFFNSGQTCSALTRMLVPRARLREVEEIAVAAAESHTLGNPLDPKTILGPLVSLRQRQAVRGFIQTGLAEGATLLTGGLGIPDGLSEGYYVQPTVFSSVSNHMTVAREEIFGPVLVLIPYDSEDQAIELANDTIYGLVARVWSKDVDRARLVAQRLQAGQVAINDGGFNSLAPFGGFKQSGLGRERGRFGFDEFIELKAIIEA